MEESGMKELILISNLGYVRLIMRATLWEDGHTLVLSQMVPHSGKHLVIINMREKLG